MILDFYNVKFEELQGVLKGHNFPETHARQIFRSAYGDLSSQPWRKSPTPKAFQEIGDSLFSTGNGKIKEAHVSRYDQSVKFVLEFGDGDFVEAVLMPEKSRMTLCLSSQVGCRQACVFCSTGKMGLIRNLSAGEIVQQVSLVKQWIAHNAEWQRKALQDQETALRNLVFMGMGEPLDNVAAISQAIEILTHRFGFGFSKRRISVSTSGHLDGLKALRSQHPTVSIAFSLHAANDRKRSQIMPINRRWPLEQVMRSIKEVNSENPRGLLIQYTLIGGVNDFSEDAQELCDLLSGCDLKVNLIPFNTVEHSRFSAPAQTSVENFRQILHENGIRSMVRYSKGQDIEAACGQLIQKEQVITH